MKIKTNNPEAFVARTFFLLWQAIGNTTGMGALQDRAGATEVEVLKHVDNGQGSYYGDYVFGRMMKWGCEIEDGVIKFFEREHCQDYQGFAHKYRTDSHILDAVCSSLNLTGDQCQVIKK